MEIALELAQGTEPKLWAVALRQELGLKEAEGRMAGEAEKGTGCCRWRKEEEGSAQQTHGLVAAGMLAEHPLVAQCCNDTLSEPRGAQLPYTCSFGPSREADVSLVSQWRGN